MRPFQFPAEADQTELTATDLPTSKFPSLDKTGGHREFPSCPILDAWCQYLDGFIPLSRSKFPCDPDSLLHFLSQFDYQRCQKKEVLGLLGWYSFLYKIRTENVTLTHPRKECECHFNA